MKDELQAILRRLDRRIHIALPIRVTYWDHNHKPCLDLACTYDISPHGARVTGLRYVKEAGEVIAVERGRSKSFCRVVWVGEANSPLYGQVGIQCIEPDRNLWESELRDLDDAYEVIQRERGWHRWSGSQESNRRQHPRFAIEGTADLLKPDSESAQAVLQDLSELGCMVSTKHILSPGTELKMVLNVGNLDLAIKGQVRHAEMPFGVGIEFREIRKGDRQVLQFLLRKLQEQQEHNGEEKPKTKAASASF